jgi:hypothetical protein
MNHPAKPGRVTKLKPNAAKGTGPVTRPQLKSRIEKTAALTYAFGRASTVSLNEGKGTAP